VSELNAADVEVLAILHEQDGVELRSSKACSALGFDFTLTSLAQQVWSAALRRHGAKQHIGSRTTAFMSAGRLALRRTPTQPPRFENP